MKRLQVVTSSILVVLFSIGFLNGCGPGSPSLEALGNSNSQGAGFAEPIITEPVPIEAGYDALSLFDLEEPDPSLNSVDADINSPIFPKISVVGPGSQGAGALFDGVLNDRYEIILNSDGSFSEGDTIQFSADIRIDKPFLHKERLPIISASIDGQVEWDWGVIILGRSVHQYYRRTSKEGKLVELRSGALQILDKGESFNKTADFIQIAIRLNLTSIVLSSPNGSTELNLSAEEENRYDAWSLVYKFGWNSLGDEFFGTIDRLSISRKASSP